MRRGFTLVEVLLVILVVGVTSAILLPAILRSGRNEKVARCRAHLRGLWEGQLLYRARHGGGAFLETTGSAFWLELTRTSPPIIPPDSETLHCPMAGRRSACGYRGPRRAVRLLGELDPVGLDQLENHGPGEGGTVLYLNGQVSIVVEKSRSWQQVVDGTVP